MWYETTLWNYFEVLTTPEAPAAIAIGAVTELNPEADMTGIRTAREIEYAAARDGVACISQKHRKIYFCQLKILYSKFKKCAQRYATFSIRPRTPAFEGVEHFPPSVWMISTPSCSNCSASLTCIGPKNRASDYRMIKL